MINVPSPVHSQPATPRPGRVQSKRRCPGSQRHRVTAILGALVGLAVLALPAKVQAQEIQSYFPSGVFGYDQELGVTVLSRARPLYETPGVRVGSFVVSPSLDEALFYNSNVNGTPGSASWGSRTSASVSAGSDWSRNSLNTSIGVSHNQLFELPGESYTDWNVGLAGGYTIGDSMLQAAYSHQTYHQIGVNIGSVTSETPIQNQTDSADLNYTFNIGRFAITPDLSASAYQFGNATVLGATLNQKFLDRNVVAGGVTTRYSLNDEGGVLAVLRGDTTDYISPQRGQPSDNSKSVLLLGGLDYQAKGVWRYRLLAGVEVREFQAPQYPTHTGPMVEGSVIWTPTELTTVTGTVSRRLEDPLTGGTNGFSLTQANFVVDHELRRNVFLQLRGDAQYAQFLQSGGGTQSGFGIGGGVTWLLNRRIRLSFEYDFTSVTGSSRSVNSLGQTTSTNNLTTQSQVALLLHFAL
jgi:hypothetical protein